MDGYKVHKKIETNKNGQMEMVGLGMIMKAHFGIMITILVMDGIENIINIVGQEYHGQEKKREPIHL